MGHGGNEVGGVAHGDNEVVGVVYGGNEVAHGGEEVGGVVCRGEEVGEVVCRGEEGLWRGEHNTDDPQKLQANTGSSKSFKVDEGREAAIVCPPSVG